MKDELTEKYKNLAKMAINRFKAVHMHDAIHVTLKRPRNYTKLIKCKSKPKRFRGFGIILTEMYLHTTKEDQYFKTGYVPILFWFEMSNRITALHVLTHYLSCEDKERLEIFPVKITTEAAQLEHLEKARKFMLEEHLKLEEPHRIQQFIDNYEPKEISHE